MIKKLATELQNGDTVRVGGRGWNMPLQNLTVAKVSSDVRFGITSHHVETVEGITFATTSSQLIKVI